MAEYIDEYVHRHMYCNLYIYYDIHTESPDIVIKTYVCRAKFNGQQNIYIFWPATNCGNAAAPSTQRSISVHMLIIVLIMRLSICQTFSVSA